MLILGTKNVATQTVLTDGAINLGSIYRKYCKRNSCGVRSFDVTANGITLNHTGIYKVTAVFVGSGTVAGDVTVQLLENGVAVPGALATETITTATTEIRTFAIDYFVIVNNADILCEKVVSPVTVSFANTGVGATFTSAVVNVEKVV